MNKILNIYDYMTNIYINKINIIYNVDKNEKKIRIFGENFIKNNENKYKIIIEGKEYNLIEEFNVKSINIKDNLEIKLKINGNITDMSYMFSGCSKLSSLPDISKLNTNNVISMSYIFHNCSKLSF